MFRFKFVSIVNTCQMGEWVKLRVTSDKFIFMYEII